MISKYCFSLLHTLYKKWQSQKMRCEEYNEQSNKLFAEKRQLLVSSIHITFKK